MANWASKVRASALDGTTLMLNTKGQLIMGGMMEPFSAGTNGGAAAVFYVDGNVISSGNGLSWHSAKKTLSEGLLAAHTYMSTYGNRAWSHRAIVYVCGDALNQDLVAFSEKTDIIGVGRTTQHPRPRLIGNHTLALISTDTYHGCRWFNMEFFSETSGECIDITADQNGQEFHNCVFTGKNSATHGIRAVESHDMVIKDCWFDRGTASSTDGFTSAAVQIQAGTLTNFLMQGCRVTSDNLGLDFDPTSGQTENCWCIDNIFDTVGMCIDSEDNSTTSGLLVVGNRMITAVDTGTATLGYDFALVRAVDNRVTGSGGETDAIPYIKDSE